jgi:AraC family transcriptional regulator
VNDTLERVRRAIDFVESRLFADLPLGEIARAAAFSPYHFHRLFTAFTGETPQSYVRKRRLAEICLRLVETDQPIVDLALDCGFESQATFTRAFTRFVGVSPAKFRRQGVVSAAHRYRPLDPTELIERWRRDPMEPRIVTRPAFHVIGMAGRFTPATNTQIPVLWERFAPRMHSIPRRRGTHTLGICIDAEPATVEEAGFTYVAAIEVESIDEVPSEMIALTIPASAYAVFTHTGHVSRIADTVRQIWGLWLPASSARHVRAPDFEYYDDERWSPVTGEGEVDIYVPIAAGS